MTTYESFDRVYAFMQNWDAGNVLVNYEGKTLTYADVGELLEVAAPAANATRPMGGPAVITAAELPALSVVAGVVVAAIKLNAEPTGFIWLDTSGSRHEDAEVDRWMAAGATVLRVGDGTTGGGS